MFGKIKDKSTLWLFLIIAGGLLLRLYKIGSPILDLYPVRQEQCAMIARNFFKGNLNILDGKVDWYGNLNSRFMLEFPLISYIVAIFYKFFGIHEFIGRLIAVCFSVGSISIFYLLVKDFFNKKVSILATLFFTISPLNIYFSRVFMPEPLMMFFNLLLVWSFNRWLDNDKKVYYVIAIFSGILSFLIKIPTLFLLLILGYLAYIKWKWQIFIKGSLYVFLISVLLPVVFWYSTISNLTALELLTCTPPLINTLKNTHFYIHIFESFEIFIFTPLGIFPFVVGFLKPSEKRKQTVFYLWAIVLTIYLFVTATRSYYHYYYQLIFVPVISVFIGRGLLLFSNIDYWKETVLKKNNAKVVTASLLIFIFLCSWFSIQPLYKYNRAVYEAGFKIRQLTAPDSLIIAGRCMQQAPLYYCDRKGWEIPEGGGGGISYNREYQGKDLRIFNDELELLNYLIKIGANYYLNCNLTEFYSSQKLVDYLNNKYKIILKNDQYILYYLGQPKKKLMRNEQ
jgi:uncharacterized membrane protein